jgi:hypothetical protein
LLAEGFGVRPARLAEPFDVAIRKCAVIRDPFGITLCILDMSRGLRALNAAQASSGVAAVSAASAGKHGRTSAMITMNGASIASPDTAGFSFLLRRVFFPCLSGILIGRAAFVFRFIPRFC